MDEKTLSFYSQPTSTDEAEKYQRELIHISKYN